MHACVERQYPFIDFKALTSRVDGIETPSFLSAYYFPILHARKIIFVVFVIVYNNVGMSFSLRKTVYPRVNSGILKQTLIRISHRSYISFFFFLEKLFSVMLRS